MGYENEKGTAKEKERLHNGADFGDEEPDDDSNYECGIGPCRPDCLQPLANIRAFTASLSLVYVFGSMNFTYYTAVITQIEKIYGLSSTVSGFIKNIDNIGFMCTVLIVSHFLRYANKPRVFSIATAISGISVFIFALPHFIYGSDTWGLSGEIPSFPNATLPAKVSRENLDLCILTDHVEKSDLCVTRSVLAPLNVGAMLLFAISEFIQGIAQSSKFTLSLTHLDDNAKKSSPAYFGFMFGMRSFAPVLGFVLGAWTTQIYVDLTDPGFDQKDPRWVGAWWLGFVICGLCTLVLAPPIAFFPPKFKVKDSDGKLQKVSGTQSGYRKNLDLTGSMKDMPRAICRIISNPVIICCIVASSFNFYLVGFSTFTPKYLEVHFGVTASKASLLTAVVGGLSFCLGPIFSGQLVSRMKVSVSSTFKFIMIINMISCLGFVIMGMLGCDNHKWAGTLSLDGHDITGKCNTQCGCDPYVYKPVCGSDDLNYFSPCFAGCTRDFTLPNDNVGYSNCTCVKGGQATEGLCKTECRMLIPYLIVMVISKFAASMTFVPYISVMMRVVEPRDKSLSLGFSSFIMMVASFPAPIVFGMVIDYVCLVQQTSCTRKGACLYYDNERFRIYLHAMAALIKLAAFTCYFFGWMIARRKDYAAKEEIKVNVDDKYRMSSNGDAQYEEPETVI